MRNWQDGRLKVVIELAGAGAVLLGLIFVGLELRQNTDAVRSATIQEIIRWSYDGTVVMIENPELREAYRQSCTGTLSQDQQQLLFNLYVGALRIQLNRYHQARQESLTKILRFRWAGGLRCIEAQSLPTFGQAFARTSPLNSRVLLKAKSYPWLKNRAIRHLCPTRERLDAT